MGQKLQNIWTDIDRVPNTAAERTRYPTQKPLALLKRIILASSNKGDTVQDPFCGCATSCVAAEQLGRNWTGIDLSSLAIRLVRERLQRECGGLVCKPIRRTDVPARTDLGKFPNYRTHPHSLYGQQEGVCNGCDTHFSFRIMTVDHIVPRSSGGSDAVSNLQLLCGSCDSIKGNRSMAWLLAELTRLGIREGGAS